MIDDIGRPGRPMADYVRVIRRGWWIVLATLVLVTAVTYFISSRQAPLFQATADDLITTLDLNNPSSQHTSSGSAQQYVATMAQVAQSEQVAAAALAKVPEITDMTPRKLLKASTVTADPTATIVEFKVSYHTKKGAVALTNAYAQAFAEYRQAADDRAAETSSSTRRARPGQELSQPRGQGVPEVQRRQGRRAPGSHRPERLQELQRALGEGVAGRRERDRDRDARRTPRWARSRCRTRRPAPPSSPRTPSATRRSVSSSASSSASAWCLRVRRSTLESGRPSRSPPSSASRCSAACRGPTRTCESTTS